MLTLYLTSKAWDPEHRESDDDPEDENVSNALKHSQILQTGIRRDSDLASMKYKRLEKNVWDISGHILCFCSREQVAIQLFPTKAFIARQRSNRLAAAALFNKYCGSR